jgi:hypothetical protein
MCTNANWRQGLPLGPYSHRIVVTTMICRLYNNKIGGKVIFIDYMVVQVGDVFMKLWEMPMFKN